MINKVPSRLKALSIFISLAAIWGASFLFMRLSSTSFGAVPLAWVRVAVAALGLTVVALFLSKSMPRGMHLRWALAIGVLNSAIPFVLFGFATQTLPAGYTAVLNATVPFWGLSVGAVVFGQRLPLQKILALIVAVFGLTVMLGLSTLPISSGVVWAALACLLATLCYGIAGHLTQRKLKGADSFGQAWMAMVGASVVLAPFAANDWPSKMPSASAWASVFALGLLCSALAYILYFWLITNAGLIYGMSVTLLTPVFGIFWGIVFLNESLTLPSFFGALMTLVATSVVLGVWTLPKGFPKP